MGQPAQLGPQGQQRTPDRVQTNYERLRAAQAQTAALDEAAASRGQHNPSRPSGNMKYHDG